jgi:hypothetical protein
MFTKNCSRFPSTLLALFILVFLLVSCSSGRIPLKVKAKIYPAPLVGKEATLHIEMLAEGCDLPNTTLTVELSEGINLVAGGTIWQGDLSADKTIPFDLIIKVREAGEWSIYAYAYSDLGNRNGFGDGKKLYVTSAFNSAKVEEDVDRPIAAPPIMQIDNRFEFTRVPNTPTPAQ